MPDGRRTRVRFVLVLVGLFAGPIAAQQRAPESATPSTAERSAEAEARANALKRVSARLVCQCGCNMILSECNHQSCPFALPERERILAMRAEGLSDDKIIAQYVTDYRRSILSAPPTDGSWLDLAAWLVPWAVSLIAVVLVGYLVRVYTRAAAVVERPPPAAGMKEYLDRVERELGQDGDEEVRG